MSLRRLREWSHGSSARLSGGRCVRQCVGRRGRVAWDYSMRHEGQFSISYLDEISEMFQMISFSCFMCTHWRLWVALST